MTQTETHSLGFRGRRNLYCTYIRNSLGLLSIRMSADRVERAGARVIVLLLDPLF